MVRVDALWRRLAWMLCIGWYVAIAGLYVFADVLAISLDSHLCDHD